jgi:molybdenum cofactor biosynthesis protein B
MPVEVLNSNYAIVKDDKVAIQSQIEQWLASDIDVIK